jgi:signal transduction histidine kinase/ligand-binding sensor domain-containing protein
MGSRLQIVAGASARSTPRQGSLRRPLRRQLADKMAAVLCLLMTSSGYAFPHTTLKLSEYQKQNWQVEDGLPENNIRMITQNADGTLLLATASGLASFDGTRFESLPVDPSGPNRSEAVNAVLFGKDQDLWIGTDGRGVLHRTSAGTFNISEQAGRYNERARNFAMASDGALWIATQNGVERYADNHLQVIGGCGMISGDITTVFAQDDAGGMFFVTSSGLYHWQKGIARQVPLELEPGDAPVAVYRDSKHLWVGTMSAVLQLIPRAATGRMSGSTSLQQVVRARLPSPVTILLTDAEGNLWIGTRHEGIFRLALDGLSHWSLKDGLSDEAVRSLFLDREQNLWIGTLVGGLSRWRKGALAPFGAPEGFDTNYSATVLADRHSDLWLGTWGEGLYRLHQDKLVPVKLPGMPIATPIRALAEDVRGSIWVGTWFRGVYQVDGKQIRNFLLGNESPGNAVSVILADRSGGLWVGTYTGLLYYPSGVPNAKQSTQLLSSQLITALLQDADGSVLVGTSTGLYRVRGGKVESVSGLSHHHILSIFSDHLGYTWASTRAEGIFYVGATASVRFPRDAGMPEVSVNTGSEDQDGHLWLGTTRGILRLSVAEMHAVVDGRSSQMTTIVLGKADGMRSSECGGPSKPSSTVLPNGTLWFATAKGFVHTTDAAETLGKTTPIASIQGWSLSSDPDSLMQTVGSQARLELEPGQPEVLFFYGANLLSNPDQVEYRYRLLPYDSQWTSTRGHAARYRRLPPGRYQFQVQARMSGEPWASAIETLAVRQRPFFYQTWYFELALAVLALCTAFYLYRRRVERIKGRIGIVLAERNRIASDCHDSLMAGFAAVAWQLEATARLFHDSDAASRPAAESCELARSMVAHCQTEARRIIWDLRTTDEVTSLLSLALERMLAPTPMQQQMICHLALEGHEVPLPPGSIHHLVCIAQEALSNAIRHAAPTRVEIRVRYEPESILLSIHDDGLGFSAADHGGSRRGHFGIAVMEERARKLGGNLHIQSNTGTGTEVTIRVTLLAKSAPSHIDPQEGHSVRWIGI